jgi:hypothetical protein
VDKRHTENQQTNNCVKTSHRKPTDKQLLFVCCLLVFCVTFVHSCFSVGFLCDVFTQLFVYWFSVWRLSTVVCLLVSVAFVHSCLSVGFLCDVFTQLFVYWFSVWRLSTVVSLLVFCVAFVHSCLSVGFLCGVCPQLFVYCFSVWYFYTVVCLLVFCVTFVQQRNNCGQTSHRKPIDKQLCKNITQKTNRQTTVDKRHTENQ